MNRLDPAQNTEPRQWQTLWIYERNNDLRAQVIDAVLNRTSMMSGRSWTDSSQVTLRH